jgi:hypothetical protein
VSVLQFEHPSKPSSDMPLQGREMAMICCGIAAILKLWNLQANSLRVSPAPAI